MDDRRPVEAVIALPACGLGEREVDLHLGAAVAEAAAGACRLVLRIAQERSVELRRRHVGDHGARRAYLFAARRANARRGAVGGENALHLGVRPALAPLVHDQADERLRQLRAAASGDRHSSFLHGDGDHLRHEPGRRRVGAEAGVEHPRRERPVRTLGGERVGEPVPARDEEVRDELRRPAAPEPAECLQRERGARPRPELGAEQAEGEVGVREEAFEHAVPLLAELSRVALRVAQQEGGLAVRKGGRRGQVGVEVLEAALGELVAELRVRGAADPERVPRGEDVVDEPGLRDLGRADRAAEPVVSLEHADVPASADEERSARERVDPAADDDCVELVHRRAIFSCSRRVGTRCRRAYS